MHAALWCKSNFSFLEGASHPEELIERAHALGLPALALTDRDGVHGVVRAHVKAQELGVSLIVGAEVTVAGEAAAPPSTCVLLAADRTGYANLCRLITAGRLRRPKGESRVTWLEVCERAEGLLALWGGRRSLLVRAAGPGPVAGRLREAFGDRLYALVTRHRQAGEVREEARLRRRAEQAGPPAARRHRSAVSHAGAPRPPGRPRLHPPRRHARRRRPVDPAERRARPEGAGRAGESVRRRAGARRADARGGGALHLQPVRDPLSLSGRAAACRPHVVGLAARTHPARRARALRRRRRRAAGRPGADRQGAGADRRARTTGAIS